MFLPSKLLPLVFLTATLHTNYFDHNTVQFLDLRFTHTTLRSSNYSLPPKHHVFFRWSEGTLAAFRLLSPGSERVPIALHSQH